MPSEEIWRGDKEQKGDAKMTNFEEKMLCHLVHQYLVSTNRKLASVALAQEVKIVQ
jgi:hypothetical protein